MSPGLLVFAASSLTWRRGHGIDSRDGVASHCELRCLTRLSVTRSLNLRSFRLTTK